MTSRQATNSLTEPNDICKKRANSLSELLADPLVIFNTIDNAALSI